MSFAGKVAVVTGAGSGIGRALALELAGRGAELALCDVDEEGLEETARRVGSARRVTTRRVDVADREAVHGFRDEVLREHGRADAVINNAGVALTELVVDMTYEDLEWIMGINFWGVVYGTKAFLPHMLERGDGWIVNVSSVFGMIGFPSQAAYNATKFAVRGFTESLRQELVGTGVTAAAVHPGGIKTNIVRSSRFYKTHDGVTDFEQMTAEFDKLARTTPERAAQVIADGMERRDPRILIGGDAGLIDWLQRFAPVRYPVVIRALAQAMRR